MMCSHLSLILFFQQFDFHIFVKTKIIDRILMKFDSEFILKMIQFMLAPAVMISACGLLLLGINNRYSSIANRIRLLNDERRRLILKLKDGKELDFIESNRLASLKKQLDQLFCRLGYVKNCVVFIRLQFFFLLSLLF